MKNKGAILAVDPGSKRIGLAVSDPSQTIAFPLEVASRGSFFARVEDLIKERGIVEVVVGLPLSLDGTEGPAAAASREIADQLTHRLDVPVNMADERLTTKSAKRALGVSTGNSEKVDAVAASILLETYLTARSRD